MNVLRHMIVHVNDSPRAREVVGLAARLARRHEARLDLVYAVEPPAQYVVAEASSVVIDSMLEMQRSRHEKALQRVTEAARAAGMELNLEVATGDPLAALAHRSRLADLVVVGQHDPDTPDGTPASFAERLLLACGRPLLFVPYAGDWSTCGQRVTVGWSESREAGRALVDALALLDRAEEVDVLHFGPDDEAHRERLRQVGAYLRAHGIETEPRLLPVPKPTAADAIRPLWTSDVPIAEGLLAQVADSGSDLLVMGGYAHSRLREMMLGGVTRAVLRSMTTPVLMSH